MKTVPIGGSILESSRLVYGCMRIAGNRSEAATTKGRTAVLAALDAGFNHFDHADIYGGGACESLFGDLLHDTPGMRDSIILTSKCGIRFPDKPAPGDPGRYDFSRDHIITSVENSLKRLRTDRLDLLLLHRPDYLMDPAEVAGAFDELKVSGKVLNFGVSNFLPSQVSLLQKFLTIQLQANQVEINIHNIDALQNGTLDQCRELGMSPQAWCPIGGVAYPAWGNTFTDQDEARIAVEFERQVEKYNAPNWIIMLAWILKHPSCILPIIGSTTPERIAAAEQALKLEYTREDWYRLLEARNGVPVP